MNSENKISEKELKNLLLSSKDVDGMPQALIDLILKILSSVQYNDKTGVSIILDVNGLSNDTMDTLYDDAIKLFKDIIPNEIKYSVILTAEKPKTSGDSEKKDKLSFPNIGNIIAVSSGKGGVGKSTISMNLAVALSRKGLKVGLLDSDIHGPSQPAMLGVNKKAELNDSRLIEPMNVHGIRTMSIGYMLEDQGPIVWRGPMVQRALIQMLRDVDWGDLDILILDMPPGTGDIPLTVSQYVPISGAVIISTPQDIALLDAMKGLEMFEKLSVDILGVIENMSMFTCPHCGGDTELFGYGGAKREAEKRELPFLGEVPLSLGIRESADNGVPVSDDDMKYFMDISENLLKELHIFENAA